MPLLSFAVGQAGIYHVCGSAAVSIPPSDPSRWIPGFEVCGSALCLTSRENSSSADRSVSSGERFGLPSFCGHIPSITHWRQSVPFSATVFPWRASNLTAKDFTEIAWIGKAADTADVGDRQRRGLQVLFGFGDTNVLQRLHDGGRTVFCVAVAEGVAIDFHGLGNIVQGQWL